MPIKINNLVKAYKQQTVLDNVSISVNDGEVFCLVGVNGAGKTTLLKCLLDFHKADQGEIKIFNFISDETKSRENLGYLPERFLPPHYLNGSQFLKYIADLHKTSFTSEDILTMLESLDMKSEILSKSVSQFSKGMAQKLGLAAVLLLNKKLLLLDEPMSGLDPKARALVKAQLKIAREKGTTIFFSSHLLADVEELSDRIGILHEGEIAFCGSPEECKVKFNADNLEQAFLNCIGG